MLEEWRLLKGLVELGDFYEISSFGRVRNVITNKILASCVKENGYYQVNLNKQGGRKKYYIHRLVAIAFIPNFDNKPQVNHINGHKNDNVVNNLEWVTAKDNMSHCYAIGLRNQLGSKNHMAVLSEDDVTKIKELYTVNKVKQSDLAKQFNVCKQTINNILHGKVWSQVIGDDEIKIHSSKQGENNSQSKLTENDVITIKKSLIEGVSQYELAKRFNISRTVITNIQRGKHWNHVIVDGFTPFTKDLTGENNIKSKLNPDKVKQIRDLYKTGKYSYSQLSKMFGVTRSPIQRIIKGNSWKHVD